LFLWTSCPKPDRAKSIKRACGTRTGKRETEYGPKRKKAFNLEHAWKINRVQASLQALRLPGMQKTTVLAITPAVARDIMAAELISSMLSLANSGPNALSSFVKRGLTASMVTSFFVIPVPPLIKITWGLDSLISWFSVAVILSASSGITL
jgi:hypothetical protein